MRDEDFVYNPRISVTAPVGPVNRNKLGRTGIMSPLYTVFRPHDINNKYLEWFFKSTHWHSYMYFNGDTGARADRFSIKDSVFFEMPISIPTMEEQVKIGEFFEKLDNTITLHQRKCDDLKTLKQGMLQKMFPKDGADLPGLRFPGFTDAWEQRKLVDLFESACSGGTPTSSVERYYNGDIPFLGIADINGRTISDTKKHISEEGLNNSTAVMIPPGTISLAMYASVGKVGITNVPMATSQAFYNMIFSSVPTRDFVYTVLEKMETFSEWEPLISTGTQRNLNADKVKNLVIKVPSEEERKQIGLFFQSLDNTITLHQRKCDELKKLKKGLLQQMFI